MTSLGLTLTATTSKLNNLTLYQPIDTALLDKLLTSDLLLDSFRNPSAELLYSDERQQLEAYRNTIKLGRAEITYKMVKGMSYGRADPVKAIGLYPIRRQIRHTLARNRFVDIDIENCHPVILLQICEQNDIDCPKLKNYVNNRQQYLDEVMTTYDVNREDAKRLFIQLLYFGSFATWATKVKTDKPAIKSIEKFKKELNMIGKTICEHNDKIVKEVKARKQDQGNDEYNETGSVVSYYLQDIERRVLEAVYTYCNKKQLIYDNCAVLCADGIMLEKQYYYDELLDELSQEIKRKFNLALKFTTKEMTEGFSVEYIEAHQLTEELIAKRTLKGYDMTLEIDMKQEFLLKTLDRLFFDDIKQLGVENYEKYYKFTRSFKYFDAYHAKFYIENTVYQEYNDNLIPYANYGGSFNHLYVKDGKEIISFTGLYDKCKAKRSYSTMMFNPNYKGETDQYNLFRGFQYSTDDNITYDPIVVKPFVDHIEYLCNEEASSDKTVSNYVINWFAHIIQKPEIKTKVALVFYSLTEGVGKNILTDLFAKLVERYYTKFGSTKDIGSKFNGEMMGKLFVVGDEISSRAQEVANELKDIITRTQEQIERKGKDKILLNDFKNYVFSTNNENVMKLSASDRRFMFIECPEEKKHQQYYANLLAFQNDASKMKHLFNYLNTRDLSNYSPLNIVKTEYKERLIMANIPAYLKYIRENINYLSTTYETTEGSDGTTRYVRQDNGDRTPKQWRAKQLYDDSIEYAKRNKMSSLYTERLFFLQLKKVFGKYAKLNKDKQSVYVFEGATTQDIDDCIRASLN